MNQVNPHDRALDALRAVMSDDPAAARQHIRSLSFQGRAVLDAWAQDLSRLVRDEQVNYEAAERRAAREAAHTMADVAQARRRVREHLHHLRTTYGRVDVSPKDFTDVLHEVGRSRPWLNGVLTELVSEGVLSPDPDHAGEYVVNRAP